MPEPCNKEDLDCRIWAATSELDRLVAAVPPELREAPGLEGEWSLKDVLIHLAYWQNSICDRIEAALNGQPVPQIEPGSVDARNAGAVAEMHARPFDAVYRHLAAAGDRLTGLLQALSHEELFDPGAFPEITQKALWEAIDSETAGHYDEHLPNLKRWMAERGLPC